MNEEAGAILQIERDDWVKLAKSSREVRHAGVRRSSETHRTAHTGCQPEQPGAKDVHH